MAFECPICKEENRKHLETTEEDMDIHMSTHGNGNNTSIILHKDQVQEVELNKMIDECNPLPIQQISSTDSKNELPRAMNLCDGAGTSTGDGNTAQNGPRLTEMKKEIGSGADIIVIEDDNEDDSESEAIMTKEHVERIAKIEIDEPSEHCVADPIIYSESNEVSSAVLTRSKPSMNISAASMPDNFADFCEEMDFPNQSRKRCVQDNVSNGSLEGAEKRRLVASENLTEYGGHCSYEESQIRIKFRWDSLDILNRNQLERLSIVCHPLKNFIEQHFHSKPYRVFDELIIRQGLNTSLHNNGVYWYPNEDDYSAQQFLAGDELHPRLVFYSFAEMCPYLGPTVRINETTIGIDLYEDHAYNPEDIEQMESIAHLWCDRKIKVSKWGPIVAEDIQLILNSSKIMKCRYLLLRNAHFSFKDYKILYNAKIIENDYSNAMTGNARTEPHYWQQFLEQPGLKPLVVLRQLHRESIYTVVDHLLKAFFSAASPNAFKIVFAKNSESLTEFRQTNNASDEKLELKQGLPTEYQHENLDGYFNYTLERSSI